MSAPTVTTKTGSIADLPGRAWGWNREPVSWGAAAGAVNWRCPGGTDFWRKTEGVASAHDGCSLLTPVEGDFEFEVLAQGNLVDRYDQVGLMVVASELRWLKAGVELDGELWLSAVHTRDESDWSRARFDVPEARLRAVRSDGTIAVSVAADGGWRVFRTLFLPGPVGIGPYSCAPKGRGFEATARGLRVKG